jgi:2-methylcitrate dehydratase PrpD
LARFTGGPAERTKQCLLDWFAVTVAGAQEELTDILVREALEVGARSGDAGRPQREDAPDRGADQRLGQPRARL